MLYNPLIIWFSSVVYVVPVGTHLVSFPRMKLKILGIKGGVWGGCTQPALISTTSLWSSSFIQTLPSPFCRLCRLQPTWAQSSYCCANYRTHGSRDHARSACQEKCKLMLSYRKRMTDIRVHATTVQKNKTVSITHTAAIFFNYTAVGLSLSSGQIIENFHWNCWHKVFSFITVGTCAHQ
jgi:hypothetical protein